ncbi:hypothetical protein EV182_002741 [Spiromyces aspiralis]|uniref:Uncharacterized protein n=1 Tax=Spiromyces aspiralis TaxID=68401 RepID=A0ACC1HRC6_9FUNG|nr:hypothetical protein EV182_002741 [Spiromyces aspiralis]
MAQGQKLKKKTTLVSNVSNKPKRGKVAKPKNPKVSKAHDLKRKLTANMTKSLEQTMAVKASAVGKLTIMKQASIKGKELEKQKKPRKY